MRVKPFRLTHLIGHFYFCNTPTAHGRLLNGDPASQLSNDERREAATIVLESILGEEKLMDFAGSYELVGDIGCPFHRWPAADPAVIRGDQSRSTLVPLIRSDPILAGLADDAAGTGYPMKWLRVAVVEADVVLNGAHQIAHTEKSPPSYSLASDLRKPALDLIQPG